MEREHVVVTVAVHVGYRGGAGVVRRERGGCESLVPGVVHQHLDVHRPRVLDQDVRPTVGVHVAHLEPTARRCRDLDRGAEDAGGTLEPPHDPVPPVLPVVRIDEVVHPIPVEVDRVDLLDRPDRRHDDRRLEDAAGLMEDLEPVEPSDDHIELPVVVQVTDRGVQPVVPRGVRIRAEVVDGRVGRERTIGRLGVDRQREGDLRGAVPVRHDQVIPSVAGHVGDGGPPRIPARLDEGPASGDRCGRRAGGRGRRDRHRPRHERDRRDEEEWPSCRSHVVAPIVVLGCVFGQPVTHLNALRRLLARPASERTGHASPS